MNRRAFLKGLAAAGAVPFLPGCFSGRGYVANGKVRLAAIGIGCQAWYDICELTKNADICELVALCDTDIGAAHTLECLKRFPDLPRFQDFRQMFDKMADQIDAVLVATPDHSHFAACMHAMRLGKHVYVEKPLANTFRECELLKAAEKKYGVVCQMGNQGHSGANYWQFKDYWAKGVIKDVAKVVAHMNNERRWHKWHGKVSSLPKAQTVPATLDWDSWLSVQAFHEYSPDYMVGEWRNWFDFGDGCMGDWGAHIIDCVHEFVLGSALPSEVKIANVTGWNRFVWPINNTVTFKFGKLDLEWWEGVANQPKVPANFLYKTNKGLFPASSANDGMVEPKLVPGKEIYLADGTAWQGMSHSSTLIRMGDTSGKVPEFFDPKVSHWRNFLLAAKGEDEVHSPFRVAAPLSEVFCLGCIAQRLNRSLKFDPAAKRFVGDAEANALLDGPAPRKGWEEYFRC